MSEEMYKRKREIEKEILENPQIQANQRSVAMFTSLCFVLKQKGVVTDEELEKLDKEVIPSAVKELNNMMVNEIYKIRYE